MKTFTLLLALTLFIAPVYSQAPIKKVKKEVVSDDILRNWKTGKTKTFFGQKITKLTKDDSGLTRTNIVFWPVVGKGEMVRFVSKTTPAKNTFDNTSGKLALFIDRQSEQEANTQFFTVTLEDADGNEFHAIQMPAKQPAYFMQGVWYNYVEVEIPLHAATFNVVIKDQIAAKTYKYRVAASLEGLKEEEQKQVVTMR